MSEKGLTSLEGIQVHGSGPGISVSVLLIPVIKISMNKLILSLFLAVFFVAMFANYPPAKAETYTCAQVIADCARRYGNFNDGRYEYCVRTESYSHGLGNCKP